MKQHSQLPMLGALIFGAWVGPALAAVAHAQTAPPTAYRGFNFAYQAEGSRAAAPTQIFDDGRRTYLQFNAQDQVPEVWTDDARPHGTSRRVQMHLESPYMVIDQVLPRLRLVLDGQDAVLRNQAWRRSQPRQDTPPAIWTDRLPFGPDEVPAAQAGHRPLHLIAQAEAGSVPVAGPVNPGQVDTGPTNSVPTNPAQPDPAAPDWPAVPPGEQLLDARLENLRREATELMQRAEQAHQKELAQALQRSIDTLGQAQQRHLLQARHMPAAPVPAPPVPQRPMLALADTRTRSDLVPVEGTLPEPGTGANPGTSAKPLNEAHARAGQGAATELRLDVRDNQRLSQALAQFLETQGWRLEWESASDFVVRRGYTVRGNNLRQVLLEALGEYHLSAVLYSGNLVVAVSGGEQ